MEMDSKSLAENILEGLPDSIPVLPLREAGINVPKEYSNEDNLDKSKIEVKVDYQMKDSNTIKINVQIKVKE